jgi:PhnB protein
MLLRSAAEGWIIRFQDDEPVEGADEERTMKITPHIAFDGQCEEAFHFYRQCLGGEIVAMLTWGSTPMGEQMPVEFRGKITHATLSAGGSVLMGADVLPEQYRTPQGFHVLLGVDEPEEAERVFEALSEGGTVQMALQKTFWAVRFGVLTDRYGVSWEINCEEAR